MQNLEESWMVQWENPNANIIIGVYSGIDSALMVAANAAIQQINMEYTESDHFKKDFVIEAVNAFKEKDFKTVINLWNVELKPYKDDPILSIKMINSCDPLKSTFKAYAALEILKQKLGG